MISSVATNGTPFCLPLFDLKATTPTGLGTLTGAPLGPNTLPGQAGGTQLSASLLLSVPTNRLLYEDWRGLTPAFYPYHLRGWLVLPLTGFEPAPVKALRSLTSKC